MSDSGRKHLPAGAVMPGPDGCAYLIPHGTQAAFPVTSSQGYPAAGSPNSETFTEPGSKSAGKRIQESLAHLPQMPVNLC